MSYNWVSMLGEFQKSDDEIIFKGGTISSPEGQPVPQIGNFLCDQKFSGGSISADVEFTKISQNTACEIILFYYFDPAAKIVHIISAGLGSGPMFAIRECIAAGWTWLASGGERQNLKCGEKYRIKVTLKGSHVGFSINGVDTISVDLRFPLPQSHVGIWCIGSADDNIKISNFIVGKEKSKVFIIRQFSSPFNEIYADVIKKICDEEFKLDVYAADDTYSPGLIIADIARQIIESKLIIADITPSNPNVFYEVGFAHAFNKPTILLAEKGTKLPFDVSGFRTLFYEDSISGKSKIEDGLRKHIEAILTQWEWR